MKTKRTVTQYLAPNEIKTRQCVYISRDIQQTIAKMVNMLSDGGSIGGYIDNVLREHLNTHKDEINALYHKQVKDLI